MEDLALAFDAMAGPDDRDAACRNTSQAPVTPLIGEDIDDLRIAKLGGYFASGGDPVVHAAVDQIAAALGTTRTVDLPEPARPYM